MSEKLYIDIHVIQTVPPSCVNRDDTGRPKTAVYGGAERARVSSQSWKHAVRLYFLEKYPECFGKRTLKIPELVKAQIMALNSELTEDDAMKLAKSALNNAKLEIKEEKKSKGKKKEEKEENEDAVLKALYFVSDTQIRELALLAVNGETDERIYQKALIDNPSADIALFGRMAASNAKLNTDAAAQVAHAISTHEVSTEYDYFTAVDDCRDEDNAGAGHLGVSEFNSSTLYRYANVNVLELEKTMGMSTSKAVRAFIEGFVKSMPTGKQNSYANLTPPDFVYVTIRKDQPINLCGAFEKPVRTNGGYAEESVKALMKHANEVYESFADKPELSLYVGKYEVKDVQKVTLTELLNIVETTVKHD